MSIVTCDITVTDNPENCPHQKQNITLQIKDTFVKTLMIINSEVLVHQSSDATLTCSITLNTDIGPDTSSLIVAWYRIGSYIPNVGHFQINTTGAGHQFTSTLSISNVSLTEGGVYTCNANIQGSSRPNESDTIDVCIRVAATINETLYTDLTLGSELNSSVCGMNRIGIVTYTLTQPHPPVINSSINMTSYTCNINVLNNPSSCEIQTEIITITMRETLIHNVTIKPEYSTYNLGDDVMLTCEPFLNTEIVDDSSSIFNIKWSANGSKVVNSRNKVQILPLTINGFSSSHALNYTCTVCLEEMKCISDSIELSYQVVPDPIVSIETTPNMSPYNVNDDLQVSCIARLNNVYINSILEAKHEWTSVHELKTAFGDVTQPITTFSKLSSQEYTSAIIFDKLYLSDAGNYSCSIQMSDRVAVMNSSYINASQIILVKAPKPNVILFSTAPQYYYNTGDSINISCIVTNDESLYPYASAECTLTHDGSTVEDTGLTRASLHHNGLYECNCYFASNSSYPNVISSDNSTVTQQLVVIDVNVSVHVHVNQSVILLHAERYDSSISVECEVQYSPKDMYQLEPNNYTITHTSANSSNTISNDNSTVVTLTSSGDHYFECGVIMNIGGINISTSPYYSGKTKILVKKGQSPSLPFPATDITVTVLNSTTVIVSWTIQSVSYTPESYTVVYYNNETQHEMRYSYPPVYTSEILEEFLLLSNTSYSIVLRDLSPYTVYKSFILSVNSEVNSSSDTEEFITDEDIPGPISTFNLTVINGSTVHIKWSEPIITNGVILNYEIIISVLDDDKTMSSYNMTGNVLALQVSVFEPYLPYQVFISGFTVKGRGETVSSDVFFTKQGVPLYGPRRIIVSWVNNSTLSVEWSPLSLVEARGFVTRYTITVQPSTNIRMKRDSTAIIQHISDVDVNMTIIDGLESTEDYTVSVSASTSEGESDNNTLNAIASALPAINGSKEEENNLSSVIATATIVPVLLVVCMVNVILIVLIFWFKCIRNKSTKDELPVNINQAYSLTTFSSGTDQKKEEALYEIMDGDKPSDQHSPATKSDVIMTSLSCDIEDRIVGPPSQAEDTVTAQDPEVHYEYIH